MSLGRYATITILALNFVSIAFKPATAAEVRIQNSSAEPINVAAVYWWQKGAGLNHTAANTIVGFWKILPGETKSLVQHDAGTVEAVWLCVQSENSREWNPQNRPSIVVRRELLTRDRNGSFNFLPQALRQMPENNPDSVQAFDRAMGGTINIHQEAGKFIMQFLQSGRPLRFVDSGMKGPGVLTFNWQ